MNDSSRHILTLVILSMGTLLLLSMLPWSSLTGNVIKDFNLFEDLFPTETSDVTMNVEMPVDPELQALANGAAEGEQTSPESSSAALTDSTEVDTIIQEPVPVYKEAPVVDGVVVIENYTGSAQPLERFRKALGEASGRTVRVAVLGDSYIEGDIFCQNLRENLQQRYGGSGVGFMPMHSEFPGFRQSVRQSGSGWKLHDIRTLAGRDTLRTLSGDYAKAQGSTKASYKASDALEGTRQWSKSSFIFLAPDSGNVVMTGADGVPASYAVAASGDVQMLCLPGATTSFTVESDIPGLVGLGVYLDSDCGIQVDCMSVRGNSGLALRQINRKLCADMARLADYDLIILEFGMNAISAGQTNYGGYSQAMIKSVERVRATYPRADILIMGVGDRGEKNGASVVSMPACTGMVNAQRELARSTKAHFWDTRAAMGGENSVVDWRKRKLVNADYIHLNHAGGAELASLLDRAIQIAVNE